MLNFSNIIADLESGRDVSSRIRKVREEMFEDDRTEDTYTTWRRYSSLLVSLAKVLEYFLL